MNRVMSKVYPSIANLASRQNRLPELPDARGLPILGAISSLIEAGYGKKLHEYIDKQHKRYGQIFRGRIGPTKAIFVSSTKAISEVFRIEGPTPEHLVPKPWMIYNEEKKVKRGLLFMDGEEWLKYRRKLNKIMLAPDSVESMSRPCQETAEDLVEKWKSCTINDRTVPDLENQLYQWSIEVLLATLAGRAWSTYKRTIPTELDSLSRNLCQIFEHTVNLNGISTRYIKLIPSWYGLVKSTDYALDTVGRLVEDMTRLEDGLEDGLMDKMIKAGIDGDMLKRIVVDLILAAGDTTAFSMQWLLYLIASNPETQEKLHDTLQGLSVTEVLDNPLLKGAIKESLRLYPTAPFLTRVLPHDTLLAGYPAYKGELIAISLYSCGRDPANFPRAQEFLPERWLRNEKGEFAAVINPNASLPFAMGARSCIGKKLSETQMSLTMAELLKNFRIDCLNKNDVKMKLRMISAPSQPLQLQLAPRR